MKRFATTIGAAAMALMGAGAMLPATVNVASEAQAQEVIAQKTAGGSGSTEQMPVRGTEVRQYMADLSEYQMQTRYSSYRPSHRKWCSMNHSAGCNKIKRSRNIKRRHRRA